jgi:hypothetical protein
MRNASPTAARVPIIVFGGSRIGRGQQSGGKDGENADVKPKHCLPAFFVSSQRIIGCALSQWL